MQDFDRVMQVNHVGGVRVTKAFLPLLVRVPEVRWPQVLLLQR